MHTWRLHWWFNGKESTCRCRRLGFSPWVRKTPWRRKWLPTPVFLPGKSHGQRSLVGYSLRGCKRVRCYLATKQQQQMHTWANAQTFALPSANLCVCGLSVFHEDSSVFSCLQVPRRTGICSTSGPTCMVFGRCTIQYYVE